MRAAPTAVIAAVLACGTAHAADGATQIYGTLNVDVESVEATGATPAGTLPAGALGQAPTGVDVPRRVRVTSNSSNLGLRGAERLAPDLSVFFQIESAVNVDGGGTNIASRNTAVGMDTAWGSWRVGQWDTPYKAVSGAVDPMYFTGITYTGALIGTPGFGVGPITIGAPATSGDGKTYAALANASFERRQGNSVQYWSPNAAGLVVRLAYSVDENRSSGSKAVTPVDPRIFSGSVEYERGMAYVAYAYEQHDDYFGLDALVPSSQATPVIGGAVSSRDRGEKLVARVKVGGTQVGLLAERLRYARDGALAAGAFSRYRRNAAALTLVQKVGASGTLRGLAGRAWEGTCERAGASGCDTAGLGARQYSLGYSHAFSRRTDLYAFYTRVANDERASYQFANSAGIGAAPGAASTGFLLGMRHVF